MGFVKSNLTNFLSFLLLLSMTLLTKTLVASEAPVSCRLIFSIKVSGVAILLKP